MKKFPLFILIIFFNLNSKAQQLYCDFDGVKVITFGSSTGIMDSSFVNPYPSSTDTTIYCAKYIKDTILYDNFKLYPDTTLQDVTPYATSGTGAPKISMKLYSTAPIGTLVQLQLGIKSDDAYPSGIHSEYQAFTSAQNAWQDLNFDYYQSPAGSLVTPTEINKIVILFNPNFIGQDTIYFDDLKGPDLIFNISGVTEALALPSIKLYQNIPNPVKNLTHINFQINSTGLVSLELYNMLGNSVSSLLNQIVKAGSYSIPVSTENIPDGIYFYVLKTQKSSRSKKMVISK